ncbi:alpha-1-antitrypsin homolog [Engraulis encrasicolus]|uniref:alpha-1-antitrypsin homolog n=1 Tax=Engraulis encrasicolus TaxID=184585 RepID=UPI002FD26243
MRAIVHSGVFAALLLSVTWAAPQGDHDAHLHHGPDEPHPQHEEKLVLKEPNAEFGFNLYKKLSAMPEYQSKNIFFSPFSISMALSMLALGAKGDTFSEIYKALGYEEMTPETVNVAYEHITHMLGKQKEITLDASNAVAVMQGAKIVDKFLEDAKHYFDSEALSVDFSKPDVAKEEINKYIAEHTNNTIADMVKEVDPATLVMLINCVYFKGLWQRMFNERSTVKDDFLVDENTKVSVDMMHKQGYYEYYEDKDNFTTVLRIPYKGDASMIIVLPDEGKMKEVEDSICRHHLRHWMSAARGGSVKIEMPKYSTSGKFSLKDTLEAMGVVSAFSDTADLSGMTGEKVKVSKVEHQAVLNVNEKGTEAAAATTVEIVLMSAPVQPKLIKINRPFLVFIVEYTTKSILFMGKITNPTA